MRLHILTHKYVHEHVHTHTHDIMGCIIFFKALVLYQRMYDLACIGGILGGSS